jgi:hypothetical protein
MEVARSVISSLINSCLRPLGDTAADRSAARSVRSRKTKPSPFEGCGGIRGRSSRVPAASLRRPYENRFVLIRETGSAHCYNAEVEAPVIEGSAECIDSIASMTYCAIGRCAYPYEGRIHSGLSIAQIHRVAAIPDPQKCLFPWHANVLDVSIKA